VLWCGENLFLGTVLEYLHLGPAGRITQLMRQAGPQPRGVRLSAETVVLLGKNNTLLLVETSGTVDFGSAPLAWSGVPADMVGTRKGKAIALLADSVELYDATRGGFLRDRSVRNYSHCGMLLCSAE